MNDENSKTLLHRFLHWEQAQPDAIYFTQPYPDGRVVDYTWKEVGRQARSMAAQLQSLQLPASSNIAILGKNNAHWIIADLAIWMAGHVSVPLYPTLNADTAQFIFEHSNTRLLFVGKLDGKTDGWSEILKVVPPDVPVIALPMAPPQEAEQSKMQQWDAIVAEAAPLQDVHLPVPADLATIMYTSGTTGRPKGVMHSFGTTFAYAVGGSEFSSVTSSDRMLSYLPLAHGAERSFIESLSLFNGCRVYFNDSLETFAQDLRRARPTLFISMPRLWTKFYLGVNARLPLRRQKLLFALPIVSGRVKKKILTLLGLESVRIAFTGSAPLTKEITSWYRTLGLELLDVYAMTENFSYSHYSRPGQVRLGYSGQALPGVECRISEAGEVLVKSPTHMLGYYKQPELTAESLTPDGFFKTGDRGELDEQGRLKITGRVKELFKTSKGKYVAPAPIENKFSHPKLEAVCVTGPGLPRPFALLMLAPQGRKELDDPHGGQALQAELQHLLVSVNAGLEDHEKLDFLVIVKDYWSTDNGFLTPTMKIKRSIIEERYLPKAEGWARLRQPVVMDVG
jgi:long-subunit acyl-CoA synthetase (AMP-forming)